ncbi:MAG: helix-turn-helix domain-containing protein [Candidatus Omnitrophota bacterium]
MNYIMTSRIYFRAIAILIASSMLLQDAAFALSPASRFKPIASAGEEAALRGSFREGASTAIILTTIAHHLKLGVSQHTLIPELKKIISASDLAAIKAKDPVLAGCEIDELSYDGPNKIYSLPIYRDGIKSLQYRFYLAEKPLEKRDSRILAASGEGELSVYMTIEPAGAASPGPQAATEEDDLADLKTWLKGRSGLELAVGLLKIESGGFTEDERVRAIVDGIYEAGAWPEEAFPGPGRELTAEYLPLMEENESFASNIPAILNGEENYSVPLHHFIPEGKLGKVLKRITNAMRMTPRHLFIPRPMQLLAYKDNAQPIGYSQTISQPSLVAMILAFLDIKEDERVLEVGAGSGWLSAVMARLARDVKAVEIIPQLTARARRTIKALGLKNVEIMQAGGTLGYPPGGPYDVIVVSAGAGSEDAPEVLADQLAVNGRMIIPVYNKEMSAERNETIYDLTLFTRKKARLWGDPRLVKIGVVQYSYFVPLIEKTPGEPKPRSLGAAAADGPEFGDKIPVVESPVDGPRSTKSSGPEGELPKPPPFMEETISALERAGGKWTKAADDLGISRQDFSKRIKAIGRAAYELGDEATFARLDRAHISLPSFTEETISALERTGGNMTRAAGILSVSESDVSYRVKTIRNTASRSGDKATLARLNRALVSLPSYTEDTIAALDRADGNQTKAAGYLGIRREAFFKRMVTIRKAASKLGDEATLARLNKARISLPPFTEETISALETAGGSQAKAVGTLGVSDSDVSYRTKVIRKAASEKGDEATLARLNRALVSLPSYTEDTIAALEKTDGNMTRAAAVLDISKVALTYRVGKIIKAASGKGDEATLARLNGVLKKRKGPGRRPRSLGAAAADGPESGGTAMGRMLAPTTFSYPGEAAGVYIVVTEEADKAANEGLHYMKVEIDYNDYARPVILKMEEPAGVSGKNVRDLIVQFIEQKGTEFEDGQLSHDYFKSGLREDIANILKRNSAATGIQRIIVSGNYEVYEEIVLEDDRSSEEERKAIAGRMEREMLGTYFLIFHKHLKDEAGSDIVKHEVYEFRHRDRQIVERAIVWRDRSVPAEEDLAAMIKDDRTNFLDNLAALKNAPITTPEKLRERPGRIPPEASGQIGIPGLLDRIRNSVSAEDIEMRILEARSEIELGKMTVEEFAEALLEFANSDGRVTEKAYRVLGSLPLPDEMKTRFFFVNSLLEWARQTEEGKEAFPVQPVWNADDTMLGKPDERGEVVSLTPEVAVLLDRAMHYPVDIFMEAVRRRTNIRRMSSEWQFIRKLRCVSGFIVSEEAAQEFTALTDDGRRKIMGVYEEYSKAALPLQYEADLISYDNLTPAGHDRYGDLFDQSFFGKASGSLFYFAARDCAAMRDEIKAIDMRIGYESFNASRMAAAMANIKKGRADIAIGQYRAVLEKVPYFAAKVARDLADLIIAEGERQLGPDVTVAGVVRLVALALQKEGVTDEFDRLRAQSPQEKWLAGLEDEVRRTGGRVKLTIPLRTPKGTIDSLLVHDRVFAPDHTSEYLIAALDENNFIREGMEVGVIGAGSGYDTIFAANDVGPNGHVEATDRGEGWAVANARANVKDSGLSERANISVRDGLNGLGRFDVIISNCPEVLEDEVPIDSIMSAGFIYRAGFERIMRSMREHLKPGGFALVRLFKSGYYDEFFDEAGFDIEEITVPRLDEKAEEEYRGQVVYKLTPRPTESDAIAAFNAFDSGLAATADNCEIERDYTGHINVTWRLTDKAAGRRFIVQKLNTIFDIDAIGHNLTVLEDTQARAGEFLPDHWQKVSYLDRKDGGGKIYYDGAGMAWRVMDFIPGDILIYSSFSEVPEADRQYAARSLGEAIAIFGRMVADVPQDSWRNPLPNFHNAGYHRGYLDAILRGEETVLSLSHDTSRKVRLQGAFMARYKDRVDALMAKVRERDGLAASLNDLGKALTHGDTKINNAVFARDAQGRIRCISLIDLDTIQVGGLLDDLGDALRSAGNPAGEAPEDINSVTIDMEVVNDIIDGYLDKTGEFYGADRAAELRGEAVTAFKQFLYVQCIRFFADSLVGNRYFKPGPGQSEDINLYRAEVQMRALEELEKIEGRRMRDEKRPEEAREATMLTDRIRLMAHAAEEKNETIVIGLESNEWIPPLQRKQNLIQPLVNEFTNRLEAELKKAGHDNVKIVGGAGDDLAQNVLAKIAEYNVKPHNAFVIASEVTVNNKDLEKFKELIGRAFIAGMDTSKLQAESGEELNYIRLCEMVRMAMELAEFVSKAKERRERGELAQEELAGVVSEMLRAFRKNHPHIGIDDKEMLENGMVLFMPDIEPKDPGELKIIYDSQQTALIAA